MLRSDLNFGISTGARNLEQPRKVHRVHRHEFYWPGSRNMPLRFTVGFWNRAAIRALEIFSWKISAYHSCQEGRIIYKQWLEPRVHLSEEYYECWSDWRKAPGQKDEWQRKIAQKHPGLGRFPKMGSQKTFTAFFSVSPSHASFPIADAEYQKNNWQIHCTDH